MTTTPIDASWRTRPRRREYVLAAIALGLAWLVHVDAVVPPDCHTDSECMLLCPVDDDECDGGPGDGGPGDGPEEECTNEDGCEENEDDCRPDDVHCIDDFYGERVSAR